jgi:hypothetical protein
MFAERVGEDADDELAIVFGRLLAGEDDRFNRAGVEAAPEDAYGQGRSAARGVDARD